MGSISLRDISLNQTAITGKRKPNVQVLNAKIRRKMDADTKQMTDEIDTCIIDILALKGQTQSVKIPATFAPKVAEIQSAIESGKIVTANFGDASTLKGKPYALLNGNRVLSGVSCTASEFNIISITDDAEEVDLDEIDFN